MRWLLAPLALVACTHGAMLPARPAVDARAEIDAFNDALRTATRRMDNAATLALWEDDGVSLLPDMSPIAGKAALRAFLDRVTAQLPAAHMTSFELSCHGVEISGPWASEWCEEHQVVAFADGRAPFDGRGKMLFVLHRDEAGRWRIAREMWNHVAPPGP